MITADRTKRAASNHYILISLFCFEPGSICKSETFGLYLSLEFRMAFSNQASNTCRSFMEDPEVSPKTSADAVKD